MRRLGRGQRGCDKSDRSGATAAAAQREQWRGFVQTHVAFLLLHGGLLRGFAPCVIAADCLRLLRRERRRRAIAKSVEVDVCGMAYRYCTGKKTPGGAGTHTGHTGHTGAHRHTDHTDEPHDHRSVQIDWVRSFAQVPGISPRTTSQRHRKRGFNKGGGE